MNIAIIMAAGAGKRMKSELPKQFIEVNGKPILIHTLEKFQNVDVVDGIVLVCPGDRIGQCKELVEKWQIGKCLSVVAGGNERYDSSRIGVAEALKFGSDADTVVLIHDAARPFVDSRIIEDNVKAAREYGACETAVEIVDTVLRGKNGFAKEIVNREGLYRVQTPQSFRLDIIKKAFDEYDPARDGKVTDDAALVLRLGGRVAIVRGSPANVKITTPEDLNLF